MKKLLFGLIIFYNIVIFSQNLVLVNKFYIDSSKVDLNKYAGVIDGNIYSIEKINPLIIKSYNIYNGLTKEFLKYSKKVDISIIKYDYLKKPYYTEIFKIIDDKIYIISIGEKLYSLDTKTHEIKEFELENKEQILDYYVSLDTTKDKKDIFFISPNKNLDMILSHYNTNSGFIKNISTGFGVKKILVIKNNVFVINYDEFLKRLSISKFDMDLNKRTFINKKYDTGNCFELPIKIKQKKLYSNYIDDEVKVIKSKEYIVVMNEENFYIISTKVDENGFSKVLKIIPIEKIIDKKLSDLNNLILSSDNEYIYLFNKESYILYTIKLKL
ncbi:hypothetical protein OSSY52_00420 [Tepiditoga spiralis]|uniref:Uncharacterized protein n=1 Tax=Tepiditoga spiralis TaxID=2108365 RepID=A0A7G1G0Z3_9BACT|nr:hypothetical protein [Tepiditoga spiralis]BBE29901.1 hypothetical protein OSSY52_00420 [Tepiditoga spiralis]